MKELASKIKHIIPWLIAVLIFYFLFKEYPPGRVWAAAKFVNLWYFVPFAIFYFLAMYIVDCLTLKNVIGRFDKPVALKDVMVGRMATYFIMVVNYPASQGAFAYYLKRKYNFPFFEALSLLLFVIFIDFMWIVTLAFAGSIFQDYAVRGIDLGHIVRLVTGGVYLFLFLWVGFWRGWYDFLFRIKPLKHWLDVIRDKPTFRVFKRASLIDYGWVALIRTPIHVLIIISMYVVIHTFGVGIPFVKILGTIPLVFFIGTIPITPGGLGTTNAAMVELLSPSLHGHPIEAGLVSAADLMFAATLVWVFANYFMKAISGIFFFNRVTKSLLQNEKLGTDSSTFVK